MGALSGLFGDTDVEPVDVAEEHNALVDDCIEACRAKQVKLRTRSERMAHRSLRERARITPGRKKPPRSYHEAVRLEAQAQFVEKLIDGLREGELSPDRVQRLLKEIR